MDHGQRMLYEAYLEREGSSEFLLRLNRFDVEFRDTSTLLVCARYAVTPILREKLTESTLATIPDITRRRVAAQPCRSAVGALSRNRTGGA
jgi:hypothetical protein